MAVMRNSQEALLTIVEVSIFSFLTARMSSVSCLCLHLHHCTTYSFGVFCTELEHSGVGQIC